MKASAYFALTTNKLLFIIVNTCIAGKARDTFNAQHLWITAAENEGIGGINVVIFDFLSMYLLSAS